MRPPFGRWRPYPVDETCKLYLPFYKYGGEQTKIWDLSTSHNDGTITGPVPNPGSPMINPVELMPNQVDRDFSGASAWAKVDVNAYDETTDLTITANAADQYCTCPVASVPTTVGKRYRLYYDLANIVETWTVKSFDGTQSIGTISANVTQGCLDWVASTTGGLRLVAVADTSSGDFDNFSLKEITGYSGLGWYFDDSNDLVAHASTNFGKTHTLLYWLQAYTNAKDVIHGGAATYCVLVDYTNIYYNAGATELAQAHSGGLRDWTMFGIVRSTTTVQFYKNGVQIGNNQTIDANNNQTLTTIGSYDTPGTYFGGIMGEVLGFTKAFTAQEIKDYYEYKRSIYKT